MNSTSTEPPRRNKSRIYWDILCSIRKYERQRKKAKITWVQNSVNIPSDRFRIHLKDMKRLGLIEVNGGLSTTSKGRRFINEYNKIENILQQFGLSP